MADSIKANDTRDLADVAVSLRMRLAKCDDRLIRLTDAFVDGSIDKELFENRKKVVLEERVSLRDKLNNLTLGDLPIHQALDDLELGNAAYLAYKSAIPPERHALLKSLTSNFVLHGKEPIITLRFPFQGLAEWRRVQMGSPRRDTPQERARQILNIYRGVDRQDRKGAVAQKKAA
jgi:hypothetical protein